MKVVIHVGLHKTATTFLQQNVWTEIPGYTYLSRPYTQHNHAFNQLQYADDTLYDRDLIVRELSRVPAEKLLISDESFSGKPVYFSYVNRSMIARRLRDLFPGAEIVVFLRDQKDIILSHYSSYVRMPYGTKRIEDVFYRPRSGYSYADYVRGRDRCDLNSLYYNTNDYFIHFDCFRYPNLVDLYTRLFDKCHVFLYEEFQQSNEACLSRIGDIVGERVEVKNKELKNVSLSSRELEVLRRENMAASAIEHRYVRKLARLVARIPKARERDLRTVVDEMVGDYYSAGNEILKQKLPDLGWERFPGKYA